MKLHPHSLRSAGIALLLIALAAGCATRQQRETLRTVDFVDLDRFMGRWYVVAHTPTNLDRQAHNAVEIYEWRDDGRIATTYSFRVGGFEGEERTYNPVASVKNPRTNAEWDMQFLWPFQADYRIIYLDSNYRTAVIGHPNRRHAWIMRREPWIEPTQYSDLVLFLQDKGFDVTRLRLVPHNW